MVMLGAAHAIAMRQAMRHEPMMLMKIVVLLMDIILLATTVATRMEYRRAMALLIGLIMRLISGVKVANVSFMSAMDAQMNMRWNVQEPMALPLIRGWRVRLVLPVQK